MKKILLFLFISFIVFSPGSWAQNQKPLRIVTSFYPIYIMTLNVVGNTPGVAVENLTPPVTGCLHDYALTANDMKKLADADILIANGGGMESFLEQAIQQFPKLKIIRASDGLTLIDNNPHLWVSISGAIDEVRNIAQGLKQDDPAQASSYTNNATQYITKLEALRAKMLKVLAPFRGQRIVTFHEAFPYFAQEFGFEIAAVVEREPGSSPSAKELIETIELVKKYKIKVIFSEPQYPSDSARIIAREAGAQVLVLDPAVSGPQTADAYLKIMENNLRILQEAFE